MATKTNCGDSTSSSNMGAYDKVIALANEAKKRKKYVYSKKEIVERLVNDNR